MIKLNRKASQGHVKTISANNREEYLKDKNILFKGNCPQISIDISNSNKFLSQQFTVHSTATASASTTTWDQSSTSSPTSKNGKNSHKSHRSIEINLVDNPANTKEKQYNGMHQLANRQSASISTTSQQNSNQFSTSLLDAKSILSNSIKINPLHQHQNVPAQNKENLMPSPKSSDKTQSMNGSNLPATTATINTSTANTLYTMNTIQGNPININSNTNNNSSFSINSNSNYITNNHYASNSNIFNNNQSGNSIFSHNTNTSIISNMQNNTSNNSNNTSNIINQGLQIGNNQNNSQLNPLKMACSTSPSSRIGSTSLLQLPYQLQQQKGKQLLGQLSSKQITQQQIQLKSQPTYDDENQPDLQNRIQGLQQKQYLQNNTIQTSNIQINTQGSTTAGGSGEIKQIKKKPLDAFKPTSKERAITSPIGGSKLCQNANNIGISSFNYLPSNATSNNNSLIVNVTSQNPLNVGVTTPNLNNLSIEQKNLFKNNTQSQSTTQSPLITQQSKLLLLNQTQQLQQNNNNSQQAQPNDVKQQQTAANQFLQGHKNISQLIQQQIENDLKNTQMKQQTLPTQQSLKKKEITPIASPKPEQTLKNDKSQKSISLVVGKIDNSKRVSEIEEQVQRSAKKSNEQIDLHEELQKIKIDNEKLLKELTIYKVDRELYEKEKEYMSKEREFFSNEKDLLNKQIDELQNQIKNRENNEFSSHKTKEAESQFLKERIFQFEKRNKDLENEYTMNSKIYKDTITRNQEVFQKYEDLKNELDLVNQNYKIQATQLNSTQIELERLRLKTTTMEQEEEDLKYSLKNINDKLLLSQQDTIDLKKKNKDLQAEVDLQILKTGTISRLEQEVELLKTKNQTLERFINEERMRSSFQYQSSEQGRQSVAGLEIGYLRQSLSEKEKIIMELRIENERVAQQVKNLEIEIQQKQQTIDQQAQQFQQNIGQQQHFEFEHQKKKIIQLQEEADQQFNQYIQTRKELEMKNKELEQLKNHQAQQKESNEQNELQSYKKLLEESRNELGDVYQLMNSRKRDADLAQRQLAEQKEIMEELKNKSRGQETELLCLRETYDNVVRELEKTIKQYEQYRKVYEMQSVELHHKNREILELLQEVDVLKIKYEDLLSQQQPVSENTKHSRVITKMTFSRAEEEFNADLF